jgi:hypothetical protein
VRGQAGNHHCPIAKIRDAGKKKYPVPAKRLKARLVSRKKRSRTDLPLALRSAIQKTKAARRFAKVPAAATSRESKSLDHATVASIHPILRR